MELADFYRLHPETVLIRLAKHWETLAGGREMPHWREFRPGDVSWLLGRLYLVDVIDGGADYRIRLSGTLLKEIYGEDREGQRFDLLPDGALTRTLRENFAQVVLTRRPLYETGRLSWPDGSCIGIERLLLPFSGEGDRLCTILGAVQCDVPLDSLVLYRGVGPADYTPLHAPEPETV
jgi:hypothetical protein